MRASGGIFLLLVILSAVFTACKFDGVSRAPFDFVIVYTNKTTQSHIAAKIDV